MTGGYYSPQHGYGQWVNLLI